MDKTQVIETTTEKKYSILLLTNRDSDNVGDQVIEASDIGLIKAVMKNLNIPEENYEIRSHAGAIVTKKYMKTRDESLLTKARELIQNTDLIVFGGAPVFNYLYQTFYERTARTLELAREYGKPVIFSAVGIEQYGENDEKCQRLKKTLNFDCVKQITTRDGIEELTKYKENENLVIARVADPAVFSAPVFRELIVDKKDRKKKKVGIFVFRANGFKDNKIDFTKDDAVKLWKDIIAELESKGYDYSLLTSGHFGDEAFLDYLIREQGIPENKCVFNINSPEKLIEQISSFDGIISCRLHPSIISFSLEVPSVSLIWNPKVTHFYDCIGYSDRSLEVEGLTAEAVVSCLENAMAQGVEKDKEYLMTVYEYLFRGIQRSLELESEGAECYDYETLNGNIPSFAGTSEKEQGLKLKRKFRRAYETLNARMEKVANLSQEISGLKNDLKYQKEELAKWKAVSEQFKLFYHSGEKSESIQEATNWNTIADGEMKRLESGALECEWNGPIANDGSYHLVDNLFMNDKKFCGWKIRFRIADNWFWLLEDGSFTTRKGYKGKKNVLPIKTFVPEEAIPYIPLTGVESVVVEAVWKKKGLFG